MGTYLTQGIAAAAILVAAMAVIPAFADEPAQPLSTAAPLAPDKSDNPAENALRSGGGTPATRAADRIHCRELAARKKLFGLGRHKFLQRCRRARRKAAPTKLHSR